MKGTRAPIAVAALLVAGQALAQGRRELAVSGIYVHVPSAQRFPERVNGFRREKVYQFDDQGRDISVGYNLETPEWIVTATVFVYPLSKRTFDDELGDIKQAHPGFKLSFREEVTLKQGTDRVPCKGAGVSYDQLFAGTVGPVNSYVLVCDREPWRISWRFTHRGAQTSLRKPLFDLASALTFRPKQQ